MRLRDGWAAARRALLEIVYPEGAVCMGCGKISDGKALCPACRKELREGYLLDSWDFRDLGGVPAWSVRPHRDLPRRLVLRLKHHAEAPAAAELAALLRLRPDFFLPVAPGTVVTWVPAPKARIRDRAVDHGRILADAAARELGLPCRQLLIRRGNDRPQATLSMERRQQNLRNAFVPGERISFPVLLVDDVLTTGATARRCADALRAGGAEEISVLTFTRAVGGQGKADGSRAG